MGSFRVRSNTGGGAGEDDSEALMHWINHAITVEVPWLSPLVPWEQEPAAVIAPAEGADLRQRLRRLHEPGHGDSGSSGGSSNDSWRGEGHERSETEDKQTPLLPLPPSSPHAPLKAVNKWWLTGAAPPPPPPLGAEALALLAQLNRRRADDGPRHVCIQGKLENSRRNYTAAFEALGWDTGRPYGQVLCRYRAVHQLT